MPTGILLLDKPQGLTSNGALQRVRQRLRRREARVTSAASIRMATGMLPICLGRGHQGHRARSNPAPSATSSPCSSARAPTPATRKARWSRQLPVPALDAAAHRDGAGAVPRRDRSRCRRCIRRSSATASRCTSWRARASKWSARRATDRDPTSGAACARAADALRPGLRCAKGTYIRVLGEDIARALGTLRPPDAPAPHLGRAVPGHADGHARGGAGRRRADASGLLAPDAALRGSARGLARRPSRSWRCATDRRCAARSRRAGARARVRAVRRRTAVFWAWPRPMADGWLQPRRLMVQKST